MNYHLPLTLAKPASFKSNYSVPFSNNRTPLVKVAVLSSSRVLVQRVHPRNKRIDFPNQESLLVHSALNTITKTGLNGADAEVYLLVSIAIFSLSIVFWG